MRKGFTRKPQPDAPGPLVKNYITPSGLQRLQDERHFLLTKERPAVTEVVTWAAGNGDRSENADYQYGKRRIGLGKATLATPINSLPLRFRWAPIHDRRTRYDRTSVGHCRRGRRSKILFKCFACRCPVRPTAYRNINCGVPAYFFFVRIQRDVVPEAGSQCSRVDFGDKKHHVGKPWSFDAGIQIPLLG
jgi:hypothetical protein